MTAITPSVSLTNTSISSWEELSRSPNWYTTFPDCTIIDWNIEFHKKENVYIVRVHDDTEDMKNNEEDTNGDEDTNEDKEYVHERPHFFNISCKTLQEAYRVSEKWNT